MEGVPKEGQTTAVLGSTPSPTVAEVLNAAESEGPYTCIKCIASTWNDCDWCDECIEESRAAASKQVGGGDE